MITRRKLVGSLGVGAGGLLLSGCDRIAATPAFQGFVERTDIPVYLAGGLNSANVFEAITQVRPYGVDLCTGVRTDDQLDPAKLEAFMSEVRRAGQAIAD